MCQIAWLKFQSISYEDYERQNVHFIYPDYLDTDSAKAVKFKKKYLDFARTEPNMYAFIGYEILHFFADLLQQYGTQTDYRAELRKLGPESGIATEGINFSQSNTNQFVPILKIKDGNPELITKIK
ncbi:MAG: ABC transporter substrate-binding protein [Bacteroidia bacterium]|nr:ABC transporter substrate-binding protein [Bacteroidia bacterium]